MIKRRLSYERLGLQSMKTVKVNGLEHMTQENSLPNFLMSPRMHWKYTFILGICYLIPTQGLAQQPNTYVDAESILTDQRFLGDPRTEDQSDPVRAIVNTTPIRESEVREVAQNLPPQYHNLPLEMVTGLVLNRLIDRKIMVSEARRQQLHKTDEVQRIFYDKAQKALQEVYLTRLTEGLITEEKIKARYDQMVETMPKVQELHVQHIWVPTERRAQQLLNKLADGEDFEDLAREFSIGPEASTGGDIGYITHDDMGRAFFEAAEDLTVNHYTKSPVKSTIGWHIISLKDRRFLPVPSLTEQRQLIVSQLSQEVITQHLKDLRKKASVQLIRNKNSGSSPKKQTKPVNKKSREIIDSNNKQAPAMKPQPIVEPEPIPAKKTVSSAPQSQNKNPEKPRLKSHKIGF